MRCTQADTAPRHRRFTSGHRAVDLGTEAPALRESSSLVPAATYVAETYPCGRGLAGHTGTESACLSAVFHAEIQAPHRKCKVFQATFVNLHGALLVTRRVHNNR